MILRLIFWIIIVFLLTLSHAFAGVPQMINYQGKLTTTEGFLIDTTISMIFTIYDDSIAGNVLWADTQSVVAVERGVFSVLLGSGNSIPDSVFPGDIRYLGVKAGGDSEMTPRTAIVSVGYAFASAQADTADYAMSAGTDEDWNTDTTGFNIYRPSGNVGIGTATPQYELDIMGTAQMTGFKMPTDASEGYVLTSNDSGVGTWQALSGAGSCWSVTDSVVYTKNFWGISRGNAGNLMYGNQKNTMINLGVQCTTGINGQNYGYCTVVGGFKNSAINERTTVCGGYQGTASGYFSTVIGGFQNIASGWATTVCGGYADTVEGDYSFAGGFGVRITSGADYTFAFGQNFTTSTPNAVVFFHPSSATRVGINKTNPTFAIDLPNNANVSGQGRANAWTLYSSVRWAENINTIDNALNKVLSLRGVYFDWKDTKRRDVGLLAEEVVGVMPEVVTYEKNGEQVEALDYGRITPLLIEAVKEQQKEIEALKDEIEILKGRK